MGMDIPLLQFRLTCHRAHEAPLPLVRKILGLSAFGHRILSLHSFPGFIHTEGLTTLSGSSVSNGTGWEQVFSS